MKIGELSRRTGVPTRMLRYYEEQDLLHPERAENGYRAYGDVCRPPRPADPRAARLRPHHGDHPQDPALPRPSRTRSISHPECLTPETAALLRGEADRIQQRIDCLARNRDAILAYLAAVRPDTSRPLTG